MMKLLREEIFTDLPPSLPKTKTGIAEIDDLLGGGLTDGSIVELCGHSGKTALAMKIASSLQSRKKTVCYIDADGKVCEEALALAGVDSDQLVLLTGGSMEAYAEAIRLFNRFEKDIDVFIIDSLTSLVEEEYLESEMTDATRHRYAKSLLQLSVLAKESRAAFLVVNQPRYNGKEVKPAANRCMHMVADQRLSVERIVVDQLLVALTNSSSAIKLQL